MNTFYIYIITNIINNKIYIGQSKYPNNRWLRHRYYANHLDKTDQYIHRTINKYGIDNFTFEVLCEYFTLQDINQAEKLLIEQYDSRNPEIGYNLAAGGNGFYRTETTREKLRQATTKRHQEYGHPALGTKRTAEQKARMSYIQRYERKNNYTPEIRQKMSDSHKGHKHPKEQVEKRRQSLKATNDAKIQARLEAGEYKCAAPDCYISGSEHDYGWYDGIKYCKKHHARMQANGTLELKSKEEKYAWMKGAKPSNTHYFDQEQISVMIDPARTVISLSREFGVTEKVIIRVRRENGFIKANKPNKKPDF